jgi:hypothetical protein
VVRSKPHSLIPHSKPHFLQVRQFEVLISSLRHVELSIPICKVSVTPGMGGLEYPSPYATAGRKRRPKGAMAKVPGSALYRGAEVLAAPKNDTGHSN